MVHLATSTLQQARTRETHSRLRHSEPGHPRLDPPPCSQSASHKASGRRLQGPQPIHRQARPTLFALRWATQPWAAAPLRAQRLLGDRLPACPRWTCSSMRRAPARYSLQSAQAASRQRMHARSAVIRATASRVLVQVWGRTWCSQLWAKVWAPQRKCELSALHTVPVGLCAVRTAVQRTTCDMQRNMVQALRRSPRAGSHRPMLTEPRSVRCSLNAFAAFALNRRRSRRALALRSIALRLCIA